MEPEWIYIDIDDTLVFWDTTANDIIQVLEPYLYGETVSLTPNRPLIDFIKKSSPDKIIVLWSQAGQDWVRAVSKSLQLDQYVDHYLKKPDYYFDDLNCSAWMPERNKP